MDEIIKIWDIIVKSNTFNFAILLILIAVVASKLNIDEKLENLKKDIIKAIESAQLKKEEAAKILSSARNEVEHLDDEITSRINKAKENSTAITEEILKEAGKKAKKIEEGISRRIESEEKTISATLSRQTATVAIALATDHIKQRLENNRELHKKFINESIEELDRINF